MQGRWPSRRQGDVTDLVETDSRPHHDSRRGSSQPAHGTPSGGSTLDDVAPKSRDRATAGREQRRRRSPQPGERHTGARYGRSARGSGTSSLARPRRASMRIGSLADRHASPVRRCVVTHLRVAAALVTALRRSCARSVGHGAEPPANRYAGEQGDAHDRTGPDSDDARRAGAADPERRRRASKARAPQPVESESPASPACATHADHYETTVVSWVRHRGPPL